jgi:hypothetical protein
LAMVRRSTDVDRFSTNAILSHATLPRSVDFKQAAATTWARLRQNAPDAETKTERFMSVGRVPMYLRTSEMSAAEGQRISQLQVIFFAPVSGPGKLVDFFQFVCTAGVEAVEAVGPDMLEMINSFRFV